MAKGPMSGAGGGLAQGAEESITTTGLGPGTQGVEGGRLGNVAGQGVTAAGNPIAPRIVSGGENPIVQLAFQNANNQTVRVNFDRRELTRAQFTLNRGGAAAVRFDGRSPTGRLITFNLPNTRSNRRLMARQALAANTLFRGLAQ